MLPWDREAIQGHRHVLVLVHGFNNSQKEARKSYKEFLSSLADFWSLDLPSAVIFFFWPGGDSTWGTLFGATSYPDQIVTAQRASVRLKEFLANLFGPGGGPVQLSFVGHSLGCRLILETFDRAPYGQHPWSELDVVALMAAAVPVELVVWRPLASAAARPRSLLVLHSEEDWVLQFAFPAGQAEAWRRGFETSPYFKAVGRRGEPFCYASSARVRHKPLKLGHGEYWSSKTNDAAKEVARMFGVPVPRIPPVRMPLIRRIVGRIIPWRKDFQ